MSSIVGDLLDPGSFVGDGLEIIGTEGADTLFGGNLSDLIDGLGGDDSLSASDGNDFLLGGTGFDTIGGGDGNDSILGGDGGDLIFAYDGDDIVDTGDGNDIIYGGEGSDTLFGGEGQDEFVFELDDFADGSIDTIADFEIGEDKLSIKGLSESDALAFDSTTGVISVNGQEIINFTDSTVDDPMSEGNDTDGFELM